MSRLCEVEGCGGKHEAHGLCKKHYDEKRWERRRAEQGIKPRAKADKEQTKARKAAQREATKRQKSDYDRARYLVNRAATLQHHTEWRKSNPNYMQAWHEQNPEYRSEYNRQYVKTEEGASAMRRAHGKRRGAAAGVVQPDVGHLRDLPCAWCGARGPSTIDHIAPLSWCRDIPEAITCCEDPACYQPLCTKCNSRKRHLGVWSFVPTGNIGLDEADAPAVQSQDKEQET